MTVRFVFLAQLKEKAGTDEVIISLMPESDEAHPTVLKALKEMELHFTEKGIRVLEGDRIRKGVALFVRVRSGGLHRVKNPSERKLEEQQTIIIANTMEGG